MSTDEQRVRTEAGWIGVELSKSRVRTLGKDGYGLWRVRGSVARGSVAVGSGVLTAWQEGEWTAYAFTLDEIARSVGEAIGYGVPAGPRDMVLNRSNPKHGERPAVIVPTRWTSAYRGSRVLGQRGEAEVVALFSDAGLNPLPGDREALDVALLARSPEVRESFRDRRPAMTFRCQNEREPDGEQCRGTVRIAPDEVQGRCNTCEAWVGRDAPGLSTVRQRQRAANAEFQRAHTEARAYGLRARHRAKLAARPPVERHSDDSGSARGTGWVAGL